jgi:hypothetical protein
MEAKIKIWSRPQHQWNSGGVHHFTGALSGLNIQVFLTNYHIFLFFTYVIHLLVAETDKFYSQYSDTLDNDDG